jgi:hypothetical protein
MKRFLSIAVGTLGICIATFGVGVLLKLTFPFAVHSGGIGIGIWLPPEGRSYLWLSLADWQFWLGLAFGSIPWLFLLRIVRTKQNR